MTARPLLLVGQLVGMIALPILVLTVYILWIWPWPPGASLFIDLAPYLISLLTGFPLALGLGRAIRHRGSVALFYLIVGFVVLYIHAIFVLCAFRNMCL